MNEEAQQQDRFWLYVGAITLTLVTVLILVKMNEDEKFAPIKEQVAEELTQMNVRVLN